MAQLTDKSKVRVYSNVANGSVSFRDTNDKKHIFPQKESFKDIELGLMVALYNDYPAYLLQGILIFDNKAIYEYIGIPEEVYSKLMPIKEVAKFIEGNTPEVIEEQLKDVPQTIKENVAVIAKDMNIDSDKKKKAIKKATGFDVRPEEDILGEE